MCLLVAQTMASELLLGGGGGGEGVHEDYSSRLTFSLKKGGTVFCLSPFTRLLHYLSSSRGVFLSRLYFLPFAAVVVFFFFCQSSVLHQKLRRLLSAAAASRHPVCLPVRVCFPRFVADFRDEPRHRQTRLYSTFMLLVSIT